MNIFDFDNYKIFLKNWLKSQPQQGRGLLKKWSEELRVHSTFMSQVMQGQKDFSLEVAHELSHLLGLSESESDYFFLLVLYEKSGTASLRKKLKKKIEIEREKSKNIGERLKIQKELPVEVSAIFYSSWIYAAVRNLVAVPQLQSAEKIAEKLALPRDLVQETIEWLLKYQLLIYQGKSLQIGPQRTHVANNSPFVNSHHRNWRQRAFEKMLLKNHDDLHFTFPMSLSMRDAEQIRKWLPKWIEEVHKIVGPSESEVVRCLNIDFFEY